MLGGRPRAAQLQRHQTHRCSAAAFTAGPQRPLRSLKAKRHPAAVPRPLGQSRPLSATHLIDRTMSTKKYLPHRYWMDRRAELARDALTLTNHQLAEKHGTTTKRISNILSKFGIPSKSQKINWLVRIDELKALAATHTPAQLAEHFCTNTVNIYTALHRYAVTALSAAPVAGFALMAEEFKRLAPTMNEAQLAAHFKVSPLTVRRHLQRHGLPCERPQRTAIQWRERKAEIQSLIDRGYRVPELSRHFNLEPNHMRKVLGRLHLRLGRLPPKPREARPAPRNPTPRARTMPTPLRSVPSTSIKPTLASKTPVEIIVPPTATITACHFRQYPGMRVCNGTSTEIYNPLRHGGAMRSPR